MLTLSLMIIASLSYICMTTKALSYLCLKTIWDLEKTRLSPFYRQRKWGSNRLDGWFKGLYSFHMTEMEQEIKVKSFSHA